MGSIGQWEVARRWGMGGGRIFHISIAHRLSLSRSSDVIGANQSGDGRLSSFWALFLLLRFLPSSILFSISIIYL